MASQPAGKKPAPTKKPKPAASPQAGFVAPVVDWERIELDYRAGIKTLRQIADENGISHGAIGKRARRDDWARELRKKSADGVQLGLERDCFDTSGFLYVAFVSDSVGKRSYKIGMAANLMERMKSHQTSSPHDVRVALCYFTGNMRAEEKALHEEFKEQRIRGEWFNLSSTDLSSIARNAVLA